MLNFGLWQYVKCGPAYQISGFYLGATPETFNIKVETDPLLVRFLWASKENEQYESVIAGSVEPIRVHHQRWWI